MFLVFVTFWCLSVWGSGVLGLWGSGLGFFFVVAEACGLLVVSCAFGFCF